LNENNKINIEIAEKIAKGNKAYYAKVKWMGCKLSKKCSELKWCEVKCSAVKGVKAGCTVKGIYGWWSEVKWNTVKWNAVKWNAVKWNAVKWSKGPVKNGVLCLWINNIRN
jgi:hypothetical protein